MTMRIDPRRNIFPAAAAVALGLLFGFAARQVALRNDRAALSNPLAPGDSRVPASADQRTSNGSRPESGALGSTAFLIRMHDVLSAGNSRERTRLIQGIAEDLDATQVREALAQLEKIHFSGRQEAREALLARWGELEPDKALAFAKALADPRERNGSIAAVVSGWAENDLASAEHWVTALPESWMKRTALESLFGAVAAVAPRHALELAQGVRPLTLSLGFTGGAPPMVHALLDKWIMDDPAAAASAVASLPDNVGFRSLAMRLVAKSWAEADFDQAAAWAEAQPQGPADGRQYALSGVLSVLLHKDSDRAVSWLREYPEGPDKIRLLESACGNALESGVNPACAAEFALMLPRSLSRESDLDLAGRNWAEQDPKAALSWAESQSEDRVRQSMEIRVASHWLQTDPGGANEWMRSRAPGPETDAILQGVLDLVVNGNKYGAMPLIKFMPPAAVQAAPQWIAAMSDPALQQKSYETLATKWLAQEPQSAAAWIKISPLAPEVKERLLNAKKP
jgi:hypothetical protein